MSTAPRARLFTAFGSVLYVDIASGDLRHGPVESSPPNAWFQPDPNSSQLNLRGYLVHISEAADEPMVCSRENCQTVSRTLSPRSRAAPTVLEVVPLERGLLAFAAGGLFLSAIPNGRINLSAQICSTWELFIATEELRNGRTESENRPYGEIDKLGFDRTKIRDYVVHPLIRANANRRPKNLRVLIFGYTKWSHGRVYYDLCKHLHERGYIIDILDWRENHAANIAGIIPYYDLFMTALDGVSTLVDVYHIPYHKIIAVSHHEFDIRMLIEQKGIEIFEKFAGYGVVSEFVYCASLMRGVARAPSVASLGIDYWEFYADIAERLTTVGYASSMSTKTYGVEWKRGELVEAAARDAGLAFKVAGSTSSQTSFHDMPDFYKSVEAVVTSSISEAAQLPVMEAAASGRLVIGTPVGHFPRKAYEGGGIIAPIEAEKFKAFTAQTLRYYKENQTAYVDKCRQIQDAAQKSDWQYVLPEWIELIEAAGSFSATVGKSSHPVSKDDYEFTADWFSACTPVWDKLIENIKPARILEIGSFEGRSTCYLIENCSKNGTCEIYCVDTWEGGTEHNKNSMADVERRFNKNVAVARAHSSHDVSLTILKKTSTQALSELIAQRESVFDFIYVDGSHQAPDVLLDAVLAFQLLRVGGILVFDDYLWRLEPDGRQDPLNMPKPAIDAFINIFQRKLRVISGFPIWQLYVEKKFL